MPFDLIGYLIERHKRRHRTKMAGSAGLLGFLAGAFLAGKLMVWFGLFKPGITPNSTILNYWPGFLIGGAVCGFLASSVTRMALAALTEE